MIDPKRLPVRTADVPPQKTLLDSRAIVTDAYTVIPRGSMTDIVNSRLPFWDDTLLWVIACPIAGFCNTFSHYIVEIEAGGGSATPETEEGVETTLFVTAGNLTLTVNGEKHVLECGSYVYLPPSANWTLFNTGSHQAGFHWFRKSYQFVKGLDEPDVIVVQESDVEPIVMKGGNGGWSTKRFVEQTDLRHDMHVTIVSFEPGVVLPFMEAHVMEHGLYVLEGKGVYKLNQDWVEVEAGDYMWLRAYCPQACYSGGDGTFRYLLYKDVNRHMAFPKR